jgi:hypothetical protein
MKATSTKCLLILFLVWMAPFATGQGPGQRSQDPQYSSSMGQPVHDSITHDGTMLSDSWQRNPNPFQPGSAIKTSEIKCSIIEWDRSAPKPILTVVCPPPEVFTPLRVFLKFSWMEARDVPKDVAKVVAEPRAATKILLDKANIRVFLKISKGADDSGKHKWMAFNALQGFAIVPSEAASAQRQ